MTALMVVSLFALILIAVATSLICMLVTPIQVGLNFRDARLRFSSETRWNPFNAIFRPDLLNDKGKRATLRFCCAVKCFVLSIVAGSIFAILMRSLRALALVGSNS